MNCSEFESMVAELAQSDMRSVLLNVAMKQRALQHAQCCVPCARRLKMEQALSRSLRAVAMDDHSLSAPASVETTLLAAFRVRQETMPVAMNVTVPTSSEAPLQRFFRAFKWVLIPAVAAALLLLAFAVGRIRTLIAPSQHSIVENKATPALTNSVTPNAPETVVALPPKERRGTTVKVSNVKPLTRIKATPNYMPPRSRGGRVTVDIGEFEPFEPEEISAKDFLVFDYAQNLPPADGVQLMRVRMPRERLVPLSIPLPRETRNENFVNADFLVGSDGVPRAIRVANR